MSVWEQLFTFDDLGTDYDTPPSVEISVEVGSSGNVVVLMEKIPADGESSDIVVDITEAQAFQLGKALLTASFKARVLAIAEISIGGVNA
jgi:hypothetical protein